MGNSLAADQSASNKQARSELILPRIGRFIASTEIQADAATRAVIRDAMVDVLGCICVGVEEEVSAKVRKAMVLRSGPSIVYATGQSLSPEAAALANAVAGHAIEFDDWEIPGNTHPSVVIYPALLAVSTGREVSGQELIDAYVVGFEIIAKLGEALNFEHYDSGWHSTATLGAMGAAAAIARLWRLDVEQATNAVGIAVSRAAGLTAQFGSDSKPLQAGFAAESGVVAATFAASGLTARPAVLQGRGGYNSLASHGDDEKLESTLSDMGSPLAINTHGLVFKPYPSCGYTHRVIDAALTLNKKKIDLQKIKRITVELPDFHAAILPFHRPRNAREARFSLPFCTSLALCYGRVTASDFTSELWHSELIADLMDKTRVSPFRPANPDLNYDPGEPDKVTIEFCDGSSMTQSVIYPRGAPQCPLSPAEILLKFCENTDTSRDDDAVIALMKWPDAKDVSPLLAPWS